MTPPAAQEQDDSLAALIGTVADGQPVTPLDKDMLRLKLVRQAKDRGLSWAQIGTLYGVTGPEMKRDIHALDRRVQRELMAAKGRERPRGPYVHEHAAPEPGSRYVPYTMTGPGVVDELDEYAAEAMQDPEFRDAYEAAGD